VLVALLRVRGDASRAQISEGTGLSRATTSEITGDLRRAVLVSIEDRANPRLAEW
jgi:hypothetical protein